MASERPRPTEKESSKAAIITKDGNMVVDPPSEELVEYHLFDYLPERKEVAYWIKHKGNWSLLLYDLNRKATRTVLDKKPQQGCIQFSLDGRYFSQLEGPSFTSSSGAFSTPAFTD